MNESAGISGDGGPPPEIIRALATISRPECSRDEWRIAWADLHANIDPRLEGYLRTRVREQAAIDDIIGSVWSQAFRYLPHLRDPKALYDWFFTTAKRTIQSLARSDARRLKRERAYVANTSATAATDDPADRILDRITADALVSALPEFERALLRDYLAGMTHDELAWRYGYASAASCRTRVSQILKRLRARAIPRASSSGQRDELPGNRHMDARQQRD